MLWSHKRLVWLHFICFIFSCSSYSLPFFFSQLPCLCRLTCMAYRQPGQSATEVADLVQGRHKKKHLFWQGIYIAQTIFQSILLKNSSTMRKESVKHEYELHSCWKPTTPFGSAAPCGSVSDSCVRWILFTLLSTNLYCPCQKKKFK